MTTLVLSNHMHGLESALHMCGRPVMVCLTAEHAKLRGDNNPYQVVTVSSWQAFDELAALAKNVSGQVDHVATRFEGAIVAAAFLRERLGLAGMTVEEAQGFVDKAIMKARLRAAGIPVARHQVAKDVAGVRQAAGVVGGFPLVVKPRTGFASTNVHVLTSKQELAEFEADGLFSRPVEASTFYRGDLAFAPLAEQPDGFLVEEYLSIAEEYHADGLWVDGQLVYHVAGKYHTPPLRGMGGMLGSVLLDPQADDASFVLELASSAVRALDMRTGFTHTEVIRTFDDRWLVGEVAARPGGGGIQQALWHAYRIDSAKIGAQLACGQLPEVVLEPAPGFVGWAGPAVPPGRVVEIAAKEKIVGWPGVIDATVAVHVGQWGGRTGSGLWGGLAGYVFLRGDSPDQVLARMVEATARYAVRVVRPSAPVVPS